MRRRLPPLALLSLTFACSGADEGSDDSGVAAATLGLPEGESTWSGTGEVGGVPFVVELTLTNTEGDLSGVVTVSDDPEEPVGIGTGSYEVTGTHAPESGLLALAPVRWIESPDFAIELIGATGRFDPDAGTLTGELRDWASASDNTAQGGPFSVAWVSGDGAASVIGTEGESLSDGPQTFVGTLQCTGPLRDVQGTLDHDGQGSVVGSMTVGDPGVDTPLGTFPFDGVHNPSTGGITLAPQPWDAPAPSALNFMVSGRYDPADGSWTGDQLTNTAACPAGTWSVTVTGS